MRPDWAVSASRSSASSPPSSSQPAIWPRPACAGPGRAPASRRAAHTPAPARSSRPRRPCAASGVRRRRQAPPVQERAAGQHVPVGRHAAALFEQAGRCWLASEIAIIGAASSHRLAYTKKPERTAFGSAGHPCELLAQTRSNAADEGSWRANSSAYPRRRAWTCRMAAGPTDRCRRRHTFGTDARG